MKFKRPVKPGDTITLGATLAEREFVDGHSSLVFDVVWENQRHDPVLLGKVSVPE